METAVEEKKILRPESLADCENYVGEAFGPSDWITVDQKMIDDFAQVTGDHAWLHVDVERAKREMPDGKTIAHGLLTLSLTVQMFGQIMKTGGKGGKALNYGYDRVRFLAPVQVGSRLRMRAVVASAERKPQGVLPRFRVTVEIEGSDKPAMVGEWMELAFT